MCAAPACSRPARPSPTRPLYGQAAYGLQFHPEVTYLMMNRWTAKSEDKLRAPGAQCRQTQLSVAIQHDHGLQQWLHGFLDLWLTSRMAIAAE